MALVSRYLEMDFVQSLRSVWPIHKDFVCPCTSNAKGSPRSRTRPRSSLTSNWTRQSGTDKFGSISGLGEHPRSLKKFSDNSGVFAFRGVDEVNEWHRNVVEVMHPMMLNVAVFFIFKTEQVQVIWRVYEKDGHSGRGAGEEPGRL